MNVLIICGESSADFYGAQLAKALSRRDNVTLYSIGGQKLSTCTTQLMAIDTTSHSVGVNNSSYWLKNPIKKKLAYHLPTFIKKHNISR